MSREIKGFIVSQDGALDLTENMGGDPSFTLPVKVDVEFSNGDVVTLADIDRLYYHASEGWKPVNKAEEELSGISELLPSDVRDDEKVGNLDIALDQLGNKVLAKTVEIAEGLWGEHVAYLEVHEDDVA